MRASIAPERAFSALGNDVRLEVLRTLGAAGTAPRSFTDLYDRLSIDSTSQFSYHLAVLTPVFVQKDDDGYRLTATGHRALRAIRAGTYSDVSTFQPVHVDGWCPDCGAQRLRAVGRPLDVVVGCPGCDKQVVTYAPYPAEAVGRTSLELLESCDRRLRQEYATARRGTCGDCGGRTDCVVEPVSDDPADHHCVTTCRQCRHRVTVPLDVSFRSHPAIVAFYWERGLDIQSVPRWVVYEYLEPWTVAVEATDPLRATVTVAYEGDELTLPVDGGAPQSPLGVTPRSTPLSARD